MQCLFGQLLYFFAAYLCFGHDRIILLDLGRK
jgi:hypothetical protein